MQRSEWWDQAQPDQIAQAWETARARERHDPDAAAAVDRIRREVQDRHGVGVGELTAQRNTAGRDEAETIGSSAAQPEPTKGIAPKR